MNLLCPNCQKPLTVPEQYAGQPMRCPLCAGTFTVPALPASAAPTPNLPPMPDPYPPPPPGGEETYGFVHDAAAPPSPSPLVPPPRPDGVSHDLPPAPPPPPKAPPTPYVEGEPTYPTTPTPEGYYHRFPVWLSPRVLQYVAPAALLLVFMFQLFPWVGVYPGGVTAASQNAWQVAFGGYSEDPDLQRIFHFTTAKDVEDNQKADPKDRIPDNRPWFDVLTVFYLLVFFPTFLVTIACLVLAFLPPGTVPPAVHPVLPWRWGIVAALNLVAFLFLALHLVMWFDLESKVYAWDTAHIAQTERAMKAANEGGTLKTEQVKQLEAMRGESQAQLSRTIWFDLVIFFHLVAIAAAGLMFWLNRRGARPAPRADLLW